GRFSKKRAALEREPFKRARGMLALKVYGFRRKQVLESVDDEVEPLVDAGRERLDDEIILITVDHQPRQTVGLAEAKPHRPEPGIDAFAKAKRRLEFRLEEPRVDRLDMRREPP